MNERYNEWRQKQKRKKKITKKLERVIERSKTIFSQTMPIRRIFNAIYWHKHTRGIRVLKSMQEKWQTDNPLNLLWPIKFGENWFLFVWMITASGWIFFFESFIHSLFRVDNRKTESERETEKKSHRFDGGNSYHFNHITSGC